MHCTISGDLKGNAGVSQVSQLTLRTQPDFDVRAGLPSAVAGSEHMVTDSSEDNGTSSFSGPSMSRTPSLDLSMDNTSSWGSDSPAAANGIANSAPGSPVPPASLWSGLEDLEDNTEGRDLRPVDFMWEPGDLAPGDEDAHPVYFDDEEQAASSKVQNQRFQTTAVRSLPPVQILPSTLGPNASIVNDTPSLCCSKFRLTQ